MTKDEFVALRDAASKDYRHPRDQARWLLRQALGVTDQESTARGARSANLTQKQVNEPIPA